MAAGPLQIHCLLFEKVHVENAVNSDSQRNEQSLIRGIQRGDVVLRVMLVHFLWLAAARAQEPPPQPAPIRVAITNANSGVAARDFQSANTNTGLFAVSSSDNSQVPVNLRPFQLVLPREHLLRDWFGLRPGVEDLGITPTLTFVTDIAGNVTGGKNQGVTHADNLGLDLLFDLDKLVGLKGGSFLVSMSQRSGTSLSSEHVGNVFAIQQVYGGQTFHLIDVAYQQKLLDDRVELRLGRIAAGDDFLVSPYNWLFMQNGLDGNPVGIFFNAPGMTAYPNATWGTRLKIRPAERTYVMGGRLQWRSIYPRERARRRGHVHGWTRVCDWRGWLPSERPARRLTAVGKLQGWFLV